MKLFPSPKANNTDALIGAVGAAIAMALTWLMSDALLDSVAPILVLSMGASAVILFTMPTAPAAQPIPLILAHCVAAFLVGLFFLFLKSKLEETETNIPKIYKIIIGNFIGFISVPLGIGGGSLSVPFMRLFGYDMRKAIGTSAAIGILIAFQELSA